MKTQIISISLLNILIVASTAWSDDLSDSLALLKERTLLEESIAVKQATINAQNNINFSMDFRPSYSEDNSSLALRFYLPNRWTKKTLRKQLNLAAQSEELRTDALEWQDITEVYRDFCTYRMLNSQISLLNTEIDTIAPYLQKVNLSVQNHQLAKKDRAKIYGQYLKILNSRDKILEKLLEIQAKLHLTLGNSIDLNALSETATIKQPTNLELKELLQQALNNRADYRQLTIEIESLDAATKLAKRRDGFHFKYIQPEYKIDQTGSGEDSWNISAAFTLPWGNRNPDIVVYQQQKALTEAEIALQSQLIAERLQNQIETLQKFDKQIKQRKSLTQPLLEQLKNDLKTMQGSTLEDLRNQFVIREQLLETALQNAQMECKYECIIIDLIRELGSFDK